MRKIIEAVVTPEIAFDDNNLRKYALSQLQQTDTPEVFVRLLKRSLDARSRLVKANITVEVFIQEVPNSLLSFVKNYPDVRKAKPVIIVGAGPAGIFAALRSIELGMKPILIERGKDVRARRRDLAALQKEHIVNPNSNYCFGEGGAGTYSDGKLYTRSKKRGDFRRILEIFVAHGADPIILADSHPHIGTNKLPKIVENLRMSIIEAGGEVHFDTKVTDFILKEGEIKGIITQNDDKIQGEAVILATGHSARDIFYLLKEKKILIENKPFALGVRIEHSQQLIDSIQYHCGMSRGEFLPAAAYSLVSQIMYKNREKGVFSFCMCPGGFIVPAATQQGEVVVNGMSPSRRDSKYANSGIVVQIDEEDLIHFQKFDELAGLEFQKSIEQRACKVAGNRQTAPAQRMLDFVQNKVSSSLLSTSYQPGLASVSMDEVLPPQIVFRLRNAFREFGKKMKGYLTNEAQIVGVESRTSSPVRIPRSEQTLEHLQIKRLFPCGEGAGYAGGIASAAIDGERCAEAVKALYG
ncbi:MAG: FAD-binding protein [Flammeovirgaceae bacterium]